MPGAEPDQDLPRGVEEREDRKGDAADQRRDAFDATQQQIHHARTQRNEQQRPDVDDQPGGPPLQDVAPPGTSNSSLSPRITSERS